MQPGGFSDVPNALALVLQRLVQQHAVLLEDREQLAVVVRHGVKTGLDLEVVNRDLLQMLLNLFLRLSWIERLNQVSIVLVQVRLRHFRGDLNRFRLTVLFPSVEVLILRTIDVLHDLDSPLEI